MSGRGLDRPGRATAVLRLLGAAALLGVAATVWLGLFVTPPDQFMGNLVRLLYIHPPMAWVAFLAYGVAGLSSLLYLWPRTRAHGFDRLAGASAEVGVVFTGLTLVSGSIWGRPTWGAWWAWDPLLTTTALLFVLYLGYLAVRHGSRASPTSGRAARRSRALIAFVDVPIVYFSVQLVAQPPPGAHGAQPDDAQDVRARVDGLDLAARLRVVHARLRLADGPPLPPRQAAGRRRDRGPRGRPRRAPRRGGSLMNPYVEAGYAVILGTLGTYSVSLVARERAARRRLGAGSSAPGAGTPTKTRGSSPESAGAAGREPSSRKVGLGGRAVTDVRSPLARVNSPTDRRPPTEACEDELGSGEAGTAPPAQRLPPKVLSPEQRRQRRRLGVVGVVIVAAIGFIVFKGITSAIVFFKTANEAVAQRAALGDSVFQLEGTVVPGTVHSFRDNAGATVSFTVESSGVKVHVTNTGSPPQLFQPGSLSSS